MSNEQLAQQSASQTYYNYIIEFVLMLFCQLNHNVLRNMLDRIYMHAPQAQYSSCARSRANHFRMKHDALNHNVIRSKQISVGIEEQNSMLVVFEIWDRYIYICCSTRTGDVIVALLTLNARARGEEWKKPLFCMQIYELAYGTQKLKDFGDEC